MRGIVRDLSHRIMQSGSQYRAATRMSKATWGSSHSTKKAYRASAGISAVSSAAMNRTAVELSVETANSKADTVRVVFHCPKKN